MVAVTTVNANVEPTDKTNPNNKGQLQREQVEQDESGPDVNINEEIVGEKEGASDEDGGSISNSSFNYFFYLIYKIKFSDIFKLPNRNTEDNRSSISTININSLLEKLANPKF